MARRNRDDWREILGEFEESGESADAFCQRRGIRVPLLKWWRWRLRSESKRPRKARSRKTPVVAKAAKDVRLVPVTVVGLGPRAEGTITVVVSDVQVRVEVGTDVGYVGALVRELRAGC